MLTVLWLYTETVHLVQPFRDQKVSNKVILACVCVTAKECCQLFCFKVAPSHLRDRPRKITNKARKEHSLQVFRWGWFWKKKKSGTLCKNRFWYVATWLFFNTFFTHDLTTWKKNVHTQGAGTWGKTLTKRIRTMGISQVNGECSFGCLPQTGIFQYSYDCFLK